MPQEIVPVTNESILADGYQTWRKASRCYRFYYYPAFIPFDEPSEPIYYIAKVSEDYERQLAGDNDFGPDYIWEKKNKLLAEKKRVDDENEKVLQSFIAGFQ
jgi:hypothetical protein